MEDFESDCHRLSYSAALDMGIEPMSYRSGHIAELGVGTFSGVLDALVWSKRPPTALMALVTLDSGMKVMIAGYKKSSRNGAQGEYLGLKRFRQDQKVNLVIEVGAKGALSPSLVAAEEAGQ
jgi:hypothetical protein